TQRAATPQPKPCQQPARSTGARCSLRCTNSCNLWGSSSGILCHSYFGSTERFFLRDRSHCLIARGRLCCAELFRSRLSSVSLRLESAHPRAPGFESTRKALALCKSSYRIFECQRDRHGLADGAVERTESSVELVDCNRSSYDRCS